MAASLDEVCLCPLNLVPSPPYRLPKALSHFFPACHGAVFHTALKSKVENRSLREAAYK